LGVSVLIAFLLFFHLVTYYKAHSSFSERAVAGLIIIFIILIQRLFAFLKDLRLFRLIGNPLEGSDTIIHGQRPDKLFTKIRKEKNSFMQANFKKYASPGLLSRKEKKYLNESLINAFANIFTIIAVAATVVYFKKLILSFGVIGIGLAMFAGVILAAYFTKNLKHILNIYTKKIETLFTRGYLKSSLIIKDNIFYFNDWHFDKDIELCLIYSCEKKIVSAIFVFLERFFLEIKDVKLICGVYENVDDFFVIEPVSEKMIKRAKAFITQNGIITDENILGVLF
jgi:hypothetical protein